MSEEVVIRVQLIRNGKAMLSFDATIPEYAGLDPEPAPYFIATRFYNKMQKVMGGKKTPDFKTGDN